jgi:hypothetical protein
MVRYTVKRKGWKTSRSFGRLKDAIAAAKSDIYTSKDGEAHPDVYIVREELKKVWAGSLDERHRPLK